MHTTIKDLDTLIPKKATTLTLKAKCDGMVAFSYFHIRYEGVLHKILYRAKLAGTHEHGSPAPTSFASDLQELLQGASCLQECTGIFSLASLKSH
eukprot:scaffold151617_cov14-Tisochrysis_lutea.AAC.1